MSSTVDPRQLTAGAITRVLAEGIHFTVINGEVRLETGTHTGNLPNRVIKNARHQIA